MFPLHVSVNVSHDIRQRRSDTALNLDEKVLATLEICKITALQLYLSTNQ